MALQRECSNPFGGNTHKMRDAREREKEVDNQRNGTREGDPSESERERESSPSPEDDYNHVQYLRTMFE